MKFTIKQMLNFLESGYTNDFGIQWNDTTCDWVGWLGYSSDNSLENYRENTLQGLLKEMVLSINDPKWGNVSQINL